MKWPQLTVGDLRLSVGPAAVSPRTLLRTTEWPSAIISLHEIDETRPEWLPDHGPAVRRCHFSDVSEQYDELPDHRPPSAAELKALGTWGAAQRGWLHIHCAAGISRSSAVAIATLCERQGWASDQLIMDQIGELNPHALPNRWLLEQLDEAYGRNLRLHPWWHSRLDQTDLDQLFG